MSRKADLQRKLEMPPAPKPPAGLAERIKTEIPKELRFSAERERDRFYKSVRFSIAVAASVVVVISSAYLALRVVAPPVERRNPPAAAVPVPIVAPRPAPAAQVPAETPKTAARPSLKLLSRHVREEKKEKAVEPEERTLDATAKAAGVAAVAVPPAAAAKNEVAWKELPREEKIRILKERLAHGADPKEIARIARESGLDELADSIEKKKP